MAASVIFDVEIRNAERYQDFMRLVSRRLKRPVLAFWHALAHTRSMKATACRGESSSWNSRRSLPGKLSTTALSTRDSRQFGTNAVQPDSSASKVSYYKAEPSRRLFTS
jgi:hypothetical protein